MATLYKITPPIGTLVIPKDTMTEEELRKFVPQLIQDPDQLETWTQKCEKDPVSDILEWLERADFVVEIIQS